MAHQHTGLHVSDSDAPRESRVASGSTPAAHFNSDEARLEDEIDFGYYARFVLRYWKQLAACAAAGAVVGFVVAHRRPTLYEAATTVLASQAASSPVNIGTSRALFENGTLASQTVRETGLDKPPFHLAAQAFVERALRVDEVRDTNLLRVNVTLPDPHKAAEASVNLSRKAVELNQRIANAESLAVRDQLRQHVTAAAERLKEAERQLLEFQTSAQVEVLRKDAYSMLDERGQLLELLIDIEAEKGRLAAAEQEILKHEPVLPIRRSVNAEDALRRVAPSEKRSEGQRASGMADPVALDLSDPFVNPVHQTLALQIAMSRTRLAGLEREKRETVNARKIGEDRFGKLSDLYRRELELARLQGNYELAKHVHADVALRYEQSRTDSVNRMVHLQVVDEAVPPDRPLPKKRAQSTALGLVAGLILATLAALAWNSGIRESGATQQP